ncbi:uncharacterized protein LOC129228568 [Uloborus diversus]|uniref:uncharacterized protein LOC129228568 n=1 Tax=Uloborus diversus TaxID=327109 RepID=UPI002409ACE8|nr:uncharacterized protein LOC129228568 [Uloborus diversus]
MTESEKLPKEMSRQFVFHPYLPHEKDIPPDEKISFHDILPVKMVKFVKQMVEEAPWEQMFMKMVRMIVDQFVDKIIEKMFAHKEDEHDKWRSMDVVLTPTWILPTYATPVVRLRRAVAEHSKEGLQGELSSPLPRMKIINEIIKKKKSIEEHSWLDQFLDYVFPDTKSSPADEKANYRIEKRETAVASRNKILRKIILFFVETYEKFAEFPFNSNPDDKFQDSVRYRVLKEVLPALFETKHQTDDDNFDMRNSIFLSSGTDSLPANLARRDLNKESLKIASENSHRRKRSLGIRSNRMEDEERLWQASRRSKPPSHNRRDECSLRQACNAGRLLSRLPSIHEITLQLRSYHNEPHWDAFLWGIKKKKCTKIYCKRHRSPKGSKYHHWDSKEDSISRRHDHSKISSHSEEESSETPVSTQKTFNF